jgi:RNA polymerase sigma factor for flagellar operon FliA
VFIVVHVLTTTQPQTQPGSATDIDDLITSHMPIVGYIVREISMRLPRHVDQGDLHSAGLLGLVQAARAFDASRGVPFKRYANTRVRGAIVDELRSRSWASRSVRQTGRLRDEAVEHLAAVLGRMPSQAEIAEHLGVTVAELDAVQDDLHRTVVLSLDAAPSPEAIDAAIPHQGVTPEQELLRGEEHHYLRSAVQALPERLRVVVTMYYLEGRPMADIAEVLDVTESRVSQMRAQALDLVRDGMNSALDPERVEASERPGGCVDRRRTAYFAAVAQAGSLRRITQPQRAALAGTA